MTSAKERAVEAGAPWERERRAAVKAAAPLLANPEPHANKIVRRYEQDVPEVKQFLRPGDDLILIAEIKRLRARIQQMAEAL